MLCLDRKPEQRIVIRTNPQVIVTLVKTKRGRAKIGIEAPQSVSILREELNDEIHGKEPAGD